MSDLIDTLKQLEVELHLEATRSDASRMNALLHPEFEEFGRSGHRFSREETLAEFSGGDVHLPKVVSRCFELSRLGQDMALLTYVSAHEDDSGHLHRFTLRSSLWVLTSVGWKVRFHQGTPTDGFHERPSE